MVVEPDVLVRMTVADRFEPTLTLDPSFAALGVLFGWLLNALLWGLARRRRRVPRIDAQGQT